MVHIDTLTGDTLERLMAGRMIQRPGQDVRILVPPRVGRVTLPLTHAGAVTPWISVTNKFLLAADVQVGSSFSNTSWVVGMHWTIMKNNYTNPIVMSPAIQWTSSTPATRNENIANVPYVRFYLATAESGADPVATIIYAVE